MKPSLSNTSRGLPKVRIIGFTGHRKLQNPEAVADAIRAELVALQADGTQLIAMSSIAIGADTVFAREVIRAGIKWIVLLPRAEKVFEKDFTPEQWTEAQALMEKASDKRILLGPDTDQAYVDCGKATVDDSDCLFAVWDGQPARGPGGTAEIIDYARMLGRKVTLFRVEGDRVAKEEAPAGSLAEAEAENILDLMGPPTELSPAPQQLRDEFTTCDERANEIAPHFRKNTLGMAQLHLAATLVAGLALSIEANHFTIHWILFGLSLVKFLCVLSALLLLLALRRTRTHETWLQQRLAAEYCRSILATWHCRHFIDPISFQEEEDLKGLAQAALFLRLEKNPAEEPRIEEFRTAYAHNRVMEQLRYFRREWEKANQKAKPLRDRYRYYTYSAVFFSFFIVIYRLVIFIHGEFTFTSESWLQFKEACMTVLEVYPLLFPALASYMIARMGIDEIDRRLGRFADLKEKMRVALIDLYYCSSWESLSLSVERTEKILFNEVREWYSVSWFSSSE